MSEHPDSYSDHKQNSVSTQQEMSRVLIIGAGLTGAATASLLRRELREKIQIVILDKGRGAGGRMSTSRSPGDPKCSVDLGAQYITQTETYKVKHASFYEELLSKNIIRPLTGTIENERPSKEKSVNYVTPLGISSVVKYFLDQADADVRYNQIVKRVDVKEENGRTYLTAETDSDDEGDSSKSSLFDAVVITIPVPQVMQLDGIVKQNLDESDELKTTLEEVNYSSRYALGLYFKPGTKFNVPWVGKYEYSDPCIRWISLDASKRGVESDSVGPSMVVHTSVPFGLKYLETDKDEVQPLVMRHLKEVFPDLPEPASIKCQRWRYSQVFKSVKGQPGAVVVKETPSYMVLLGGDSFTHSNFDGCISSATTLTEKLVAFLKSTSKL
ncbi:renalase-like [Ptychodera flava]|uniref:renalase-like n=1 Tax=Ptychodera flava TaxID=63121 RepID=UPI00396A777E